MSIKKALLLSSLLLAFAATGQVKAVYKINDLLRRINTKSDTVYVVNFWATWCKPCVQELPGFDSLLAIADKKTKILLVCLDFKDELDKKVNPFLIKHQVQAECVLLDEVNGNTFVDKIATSWSGAIPATLFKKGKKENLVEKKMKFSELQNRLKELN